MVVTVIDRSALNADWGHRVRSIQKYLRQIEIADKCPVCEGPRSRAQTRRYHELGEFYYVDNWVNPCGHVDMYPDCLKEAARLRDEVRA